MDEFIISGGRMDNIAAEFAVHATTWGAIGGILRGLWYLNSKVNNRTYRGAFSIYFLSVPFLGAIFDSFIYTIILGILLDLF